MATVVCYMTQCPYNTSQNFCSHSTICLNRGGACSTLYFPNGQPRDLNLIIEQKKEWEELVKAAKQGCMQTVRENPPQAKDNIQSQDSASEEKDAEGKEKDE